MAEFRPFLRWAGSKNKLMPELRKYLPDKPLRYIEPFMGSASLFFDIGPSSAVLSDINKDLVDTFCAVRDFPDSVYNYLNEMPKGKEAYYLIRERDYSKKPVCVRAARFIYLNRFCFNGLYRTNNKGKFNVPYADSKTGKLPTLEYLQSASVRLRSAKILCMDFEEALMNIGENDFIYMDPPYAVKNSKIFHQYGPDSFGINDLTRLAAMLDRINDVGALFVISYAFCPEALSFFDKWNIRQVKTIRSIAGFSCYRKNAFEVLVTNRLTK